MNKPTSGKDRRDHHRYNATVALEGGAPDSGVMARMVASNLSLGGLYCTSTADFPEMTRLAVRLMLPQDGKSSQPAPVDAEAVVVRREVLPSANGDPRYRFALFFTGLEEAVRDRLRSYLETL